MDSLKDRVRPVAAGYSGKGLNGISYLTQSDDGNVMTVTGFTRQKGEHVSSTSLIVRIVGDFVIIEHDMNDKPLVDALVQAGIPRAQIILAYAGEPIPETA
jgi:hypothetical protein